MHGLYLLWWVQEKQMSPAIVAAVLAADDLALMGLELPTGGFADRFGHRASLMAGSFVQVMGMLCEGASGADTRGDARRCRGRSRVPPSRVRAVPDELHA